MKINKVTITGADDKVEPSDLVELTRKFPFVEWGILFSNSKDGEKRYPTREWRDAFTGHNLPLSAHFCGWYSRAVLEKQISSIITELHPDFKRIQLNYSFDMNELWSLMSCGDIINQNPNRSFIFQWNKKNEADLRTWINWMFRVSGNVDFLYDASGGFGKKIESIEPPINSGDKIHYTGYAGGLNPENISEVMEKIISHPSKESVWIDLESGVRDTMNNFDLDKVEDVLKQASKYILI